MVELVIEIIKFPLKLLYYVVGGFLFLVGSVFVHGDNKTGEKISAGLIATLSFAVAAVYYYFNSLKDLKIPPMRMVLELECHWHYQL